MRDRFHPDHGAIVTFLEKQDDEGTVFCRAVALGPELDDPQTDETWIPILRTDGVVTLIDPESVVDVLPDRPTDDPELTTTEVMATTRRALRVAMHGLESPDADAGHAQVLLDDFVAAISPVQATLDVLLTVDPTGTLAGAVSYLINADAHLDDDGVPASRAAVHAAHVVLDGLSFRPEPQ